MDKESKGIVPKFMELTGGDRPVWGGLTRGALLGTLGYFGGKAIGGVRDIASGDPGSDYAGRASKTLGTAGALGGLLTGVPGLLKNINLGIQAGSPLKYLNTPTSKYRDPEFMQKYISGLPDRDVAHTTNDLLISHGKELGDWVNKFKPGERNMAIELARLNLERERQRASGFWAPANIVPSDYPDYNSAAWQRLQPLVKQLTNYGRVYNKQPYHIRDYVRSQVFPQAVKAGAFGDSDDAGFTGVLDIGDLDTYLPADRYGHGFPAHYTEQQIRQDPYLGPASKASAISLIRDASNHRPGLITWGDVARAGVGAGIGYGSSKLFGKVLDGVFGGLAPSTHKRLVQGGTIAGMLLNTGAIGS